MNTKKKISQDSKNVIKEGKNAEKEM